MTPPIIPPHKLTMILMMSVVREISDCEINPIVDIEARSQPRMNPPTTFKIFIELFLHPGLASPLSVLSSCYSFNLDEFHSAKVVLVAEVFVGMVKK
jgi:hypothetical protein